MGKRTKLGIYFSYNENWIGSTYYIINIIEALKTIPDNDLPKIYFISENPKDLEIIKNKLSIRQIPDYWEKSKKRIFKQKP